MYELSRVRLHSVGPTGARYQDVTLDMRDVGEPVTRPTATATLFDTEYQVQRRPSPASVLFAENGNGKTVLVKLIFSVMLPGRKQIVGTSNTKAMDNFVLADDVAHVALEWMHVETGALVVTGKASAWRDHRVSNDSNRLSEAWYAFRPTNGLALDSLPFAEDGRLIELPGFKDRLEEADRAHPHLEMTWETIRGEWTKKLDKLGLDPELFAYQRRMNAGEGEAANAFSFKSDEAFVDWLLDAVLDKEGPASMSELIEMHAGRVAERDGVVAERDFVDGALQRLTPLAAAARDHDSAQELQAEASRDATRLVIAFDLRHRAEEGQLARLAEDHARINEQVDQADREQRRLKRIVVELRRTVAGLRLAKAEEHEGQLIKSRNENQTILDAWHATDSLLRFSERHELANAVRKVIREQEHQAEAPLAARDAAARRLVHGLIHAAKAADDAASTADADAEALVERINTAAEEETGHHKSAVQFQAEAKAVQGRIDEVNASIAIAVTDGLLVEGEDLSTAARRAVDAAGTAETEASQADQTLDTLRNSRSDAQVKQVTLDREAGVRRRDADHAEEVCEAARKTSTLLASEPRLAALLGVEDVFLDTDTDTLDERLGAALEVAESERERLRDADREDQRILSALGVGGLLPPPAGVTAVRDKLRDAGITCYAGWEYIAQMPDDERGTALRLYPHLIDGVVLNNPEQADDAEALLVEARLLPSAVVAVGATSAFEDLVGRAPAGLRFLVEPNPALYDEDLAETERQRLETVKAERRTLLTTVAKQITEDQSLRGRLTQWREAYPPGSLDNLAETVEITEAAAAKAEGAAKQAQEALDALAEHEKALAEALPALREKATSARKVAARLARLADRYTSLPGWTEKRRTHQENSSLEEKAAEAAHEEAERLRTRRVEALRLRDGHKRTAAARRDEIKKILGGGEVDPSTEPPAEAVETLKSIYRAAVDAYEKVQVGANLKAGLEARERAEAEAQAEVENLPADVQTTASALLASPDGGDAPARAAATERARRRLDDLDGAIRAAGKDVGELKFTYEQFQPQETSLDRYGRPNSIVHGEELVARASADWQAAVATHSEIKAKADEVQGIINTTSREAEAFGDVVDTLKDALPAEPTESQSQAAYAGTLIEARSRRDTVRTALTEANDLLGQSERGVRAASSKLNRYAIADQFANVDSPVRRQILSVDPDRLHEYGPDWEEALKPRLRSLQDELAQIDRHRNQIIQSLRGHVETALRTLKSAERVSQLPESLGDWAGQHFLRIRFKDPDHATLNEHLATVVDNAVSPDRGGGKRDGMSVLLKGVHAALPQGVKVEMLKPDTTLRTERVRINQVSDVFSGGQELTAAIILYCTMAALRANDRGRRNKHSGVLFLDNPIGRASAGYLLELQLGVARELGVQLVYTTGLFDIDALSVFPLIIRLRNDSDVRSGMKYLTVDDEVRRRLAELGEPDGTGKITAARLFRRPNDRSATAELAVGKVE